MNLPGEIPRQTEARRQIRRTSLIVEGSPEGGYVLWSPDAPGWKAPVRTNAEAGQALHDALVESQIAAYARAHGAAYDHAVGTDHDPADLSTAFAARRRRRNASRVSPGWSENEDGSLTSPGGYTYARTTKVAQRVLAARRAEALSDTPDADTPSEGVTSGEAGTTAPPDGPD